MTAATAASAMDERQRACPSAAWSWIRRPLVWRASYLSDVLIGPARIALAPAGEDGGDGSGLFECYFARESPEGLGCGWLGACLCRMPCVSQRLQRPLACMRFASTDGIDDAALLAWCAALKEGSGTGVVKLVSDEVGGLS